MRILIIPFFMLLAEPGLPGVGGKLNVTLKSSGSCQGAQILLKDVAELTGPDEAIEKVMGAFVGAAPMVGKTRQLRADQVRLHLLRAGLKVAEFDLAGAPEVAVTRVSQQIAAADILNAIRLAAADQAPDQDVELDFVGSVSPVNLPPGDAHLSVSQIVFYGSNAACSVTFSIGGMSVKTARYTLKATRFGEALVSVRDLDKGAILAADDLAPERVKLVPGKQFLMRGDEYVGSEVVSRLIAGEPVPMRGVASPLLIQKGSQVTLRARIAGCEVTCAVTAMQDGRSGQIIRLKADHTDKLLTGRVTGPQQADALVMPGGH